MTDPDKFVALSAPEFDVPDPDMKEALAGVKYTTFEEPLAYMPISDEGQLKQVFDDFNDINISLDLQDAALSYSPYVDSSLLDGLFEGVER